jgi:predicted RND superfamily exporter protein
VSASSHLLTSGQVKSISISRLSMITSLIASIAIGLAVDDTIHYLYRYNLEFKSDLNKDRALRDTHIRKAGKPIRVTTITISIGFFTLLFSHFKPTAIFYHQNNRVR